MKFALFIVGICVLLMIVIVAVAYICDRIRIGRNTPPPDGQTSATMTFALIQGTLELINVLTLFAIT